MQATQAWFGDNALAFNMRDGDAAVLAMGGETMANQIFEVKVGQTVQAGPYEITVLGFGYRNERDVVDVIVSVPGGGAMDGTEGQDR